MKEVLFIGLTNIDIIYRADEFTLVENSKQKVNDFSFKLGGPACNAAIEFAKLNGHATLVTSFGNSFLSNYINNELNKQNVRVINVSEENNLPNISSVIVNKNKSTRTIISGQINSFNPAKLQYFLKNNHFDAALYDCNFIDSTKDIIDILKANEIEISLDLGNKKDNSDYAIKHAKYIIASSNYLDYLKSDTVKGKDFAVTQGENNIIYLSHDEVNEIEVKSLTNVNTLGAGDTFHGCFMFYKYIKDLSFYDSLKKSASEVYNFLIKN